MRARVFFREQAGWQLACELEAADPDDVWRQLQRDPLPGPRKPAVGDIVYVGDLYWELDGDGGWRPLKPGAFTQELYRLATEGDRASE
jgi:hypothetical protein